MQLSQKQLRHHGWYFLGVFAVVLRQLDCRPIIPFKQSLHSVRSLVDFNMIVQFQCHTPEIAHMQDCFNQFHVTKDICFQFQFQYKHRPKLTSCARS